VARIGSFQRLRSGALPAAALPIAGNRHIDGRGQQMFSYAPARRLAVQRQTERRIGREVPDVQQ
jgi:hypothetical protein